MTPISPEKVTPTGRVIMTSDCLLLVFSKMGLRGGAASWQTQKQQTVTLPSCESEFHGLVAAMEEETTFLRSILCEMG